jgi:hypothetical protein
VSYLLQRHTDSSWERIALPCDRATALIAAEDHSTAVRHRVPQSRGGSEAQESAAEVRRLRAEGLPEGASSLPTGTLAVLVPHRRQGPVHHVLLVCDGPVLRNASIGAIEDVAELRNGECLTWLRDGHRHQVFYDAFTPALVEDYSGQELPCPICGSVVLKGTLAVQCTRCGVAYHETEGAHCYGAASSCAACGHPTRLGDKSNWAPNGFNQPPVAGRACRAVSEETSRQAAALDADGAAR